MSHPLLVMPLPFRTVRSLRRRSKDNTGLNLQGPDVNRESREQISGQHRGVRRSPWMPPSPLPAQNRVESGKIGFLRVESGIIGSGRSARTPKTSLKRAPGRQEPFWVTNGRFKSRNPGGIWRGSRSRILAWPGCLAWLGGSARQNRVESGKIGFLRVKSGIIGSGRCARLRALRGPLGRPSALKGPRVGL